MHTQGCTRECLQPCLADRIAAALANAVGAVIESLQGPLDLGQQIPAVGGERHLVLALEGLGAGVGLVVAGAVAAVTLQRCPGLLGIADLAAQLARLPIELDPDLGQLGLGPGPLARQDGRARLGDPGRRCRGWSRPPPSPARAQPLPGPPLALEPAVTARPLAPAAFFAGPPWPAAFFTSAFAGAAFFAAADFFAAAVASSPVPQPS